MDPCYKAYVDSIVRRGELAYELSRIQRLLVHHESNPHPVRADQATTVRILTGMFKALLSAKESRQEVVQNVRQNDSGNTEHCSARPAYHTRPRVGVWDILEEEVPGS